MNLEIINFVVKFTDLQLEDESKRVNLAIFSLLYNFFHYRLDFNLKNNLEGQKYREDE